MLVTSYFLEKDLKDVPQLSPRWQVDLSDEPPAMVHLLVSTSYAAQFTANDKMIVLLMKRNVANTADNYNNLNYNYNYDLMKARRRRNTSGAATDRAELEIAEWQEVHRARMVDLDDFTELQYPLEAAKNVELRVSFYRHVIHTGKRTEVCHADIKLQDVISHPGSELVLAANESEKADDEQPGDTGKNAVGTVSFRVCYMRHIRDRFLADIKVSVDRSKGWPFKSARPFFIVYVQPDETQPWLPVYRSEIVTPATVRCDRHGVMHFAPVEVPNSEVRIVDDSKIRVEFFHYKTSGHFMLLGYVQLKASELRQKRTHTKLPIIVNDFPQGELEGSVSLESKYITACTTFYGIRATFGGETTSDCVYFDIIVSTSKGKTKGRPFFTIHRGSPELAEMYRSELPWKTPLGYQYQEAFISTKRLRGDREDRMPVAVRLYRRGLLKGTEQIAEVKRSVGEWMDLKRNEKLALDNSNNENNYEGPHVVVRGVGTRAAKDGSGSLTQISLTFVLDTEC